MRFIKSLSVVALSMLLAACDHGFEGTYQTKLDSGNEFANAMVGGLLNQKIIIGKDYIETDGKRTEFEDVFVRASGDERYLVFKDKEAEEAWKIVDDKTLLQGNGFINIQLVRVD